MTPAQPRIKAACPVCGVELVYSRTNNPDGSFTITLTQHGTNHVEGHYR